MRGVARKRCQRHAPCVPSWDLTSDSEPSSISRAQRMTSRAPSRPFAGEPLVIRACAVDMGGLLAGFAMQRVAVRYPGRPEINPHSSAMHHRRQKGVGVVTFVLHRAADRPLHIVLRASLPRMHMWYPFLFSTRSEVDARLRAQFPDAKGERKNFLQIV